MKKIVARIGSSRNSNRMADSFVAAAQEEGCIAARFDTAFMNVGGCQACLTSEILCRRAARNARLLRLQKYAHSNSRS